MRPFVQHNSMLQGEAVEAVHARISPRTSLCIPLSIATGATSANVLTGKIKRLTRLRLAFHVPQVAYKLTHASEGVLAASTPQVPHRVA
jgi:hypothetical protein